MFFREKKTAKKPVLQLVENRRNAKGKVRQKVVVSLGGCPVPDEYRKAVASEVTQRAAGYQRILEPDSNISYWTRRVLERMEEAGALRQVTHMETTSAPGKKYEMVCAEDVDHADGVELGPHLVLQRAWESLELDDVLGKRGFSREHIATAKISIFNRLVEPVSENELPDWTKTTALRELFGVHPERWAEDRFYRISDRLLAARKSIEIHLREHERNLFNLDRTILLYDLTNSYFEGTAERNALAARSAASKEKRSDCPLISVGVVLDAEGFVITHKVFAGNIGDCKTLMKAVNGLEKTAGEGGKPVVVVDGGMATNGNLEQLKKHGYDYVVNGKRQTRARFAEDFYKKDSFTRVEGRSEKASKQPVFVRKLKVEGETVVLCRSNGRRDKEDAIQDKAERKLIEGLENIEARILRNDPRLKLDRDASLVNRAVGRLAARTTRASKLYDISYDHQCRNLTWNRRETEWADNRDLHGCYHLRSSLNLGDEKLWKLYITLTRVEDAFRAMKTELGLRPFNHQLERRCRAHVWITILAYHLLRWTEFSLHLGGYECTWRRIKRRLQTHCYTTVIVPTSEGLEHHTRKPGRPNEAQKLIYSLLGVEWRDLPVHRHTYRQRQCAKT